MRLRLSIPAAVVLVMTASLYGGVGAPFAELDVSVVSGATARTGCVGCVSPDPDNLCLTRSGAAPVRMQVVFANDGTDTSAGILRYDDNTITIVTSPPGWTCTLGACTSPSFPLNTGVPAGSSHTFVFDYTPPTASEVTTAFRGELEGGSSDDVCVAVVSAAVAAGPGVPALDGFGLALLTLAVAAVAVLILRGR